MSTPITADRLSDIQRTVLDGARVQAQAFVVEDFGTARIRVWKRIYAPPVIWIATPEDLEDDARKYARHQGVVGSVVRPLLGGSGSADCVVTGSVVNGEVLAYRRFLEESAPHPAMRPTYVLLPGRFNNSGKNYHHADDPARVIATALTEVEARAAAKFYNIDAELEIWRHHVKVYDHAVHGAGALWDALALHLPARSGRWLERTHRSVELLHQTLLQGVADLAAVESLVEEQDAEIDKLADEIAWLVDGKLTEEHLPSEQTSIRGSLTRTGHFERLRQMQKSTAADATRVQEQYRDLLQSMSHAFDERRVRELEVLQRGGFLLSIAVVGVALVTVLDFTVNVKHPGMAPWRWWLIYFGWGVIATMVMSTIYTIVRYWRSRHLGSRHFRREYDDLTNYLRQSSTRELDRYRPNRATPESQDYSSWAGDDSNLCASFARLWDLATKEEPKIIRRRKRRKQLQESTAKRRMRRIWDAWRATRLDLKILRKEAECWAIRTLLLTERPRVFWKYPLPNLTLLYRHCTALSRAKVVGAGVAVVADIDMWQALRHRGFTWEECQAIDRWVSARLAQQKGKVSTVQLLDMIKKIKLSAALRPASSDVDDAHNEVLGAVGICWVRIESGRSIDNPTKEDIAQLLTELGNPRNTFLVVEWPSGVPRWQALARLRPDGAYEVEYREDLTRQHRIKTGRNASQIAADLTEWVAKRKPSTLLGERPPTALPNSR
jgi:hypothetical protein